MNLETQPPKLRPIGDRIYVKELPLPDTSPGGIIKRLERGSLWLPGEVLALGPRCKLEISVGDTVYFSRVAGYPDSPEGTRILNSHDVALASEFVSDVSTYDRGIGRR